MLGKRWMQWLAVFLAIPVVGLGLALWIRTQQMARASEVLAVLTETAHILWLAYGLWAWRDRPRIRWAAGLVLGTAAAAAAIGLGLWFGWRSWAIAVVGVWAMTVGFAVGLAAIRAVLSLGHPVMGVARTLVDEAIRMKIALIFIVAMVALVPVLPLLLDPKERLQYRMQFFLAWSLAGMSVLLSLMTIFLACGTVAWDLSKRFVYLTMSKPISRGQYLLGKWLGIVLLNLLLVAVGGTGIYAFARILQQQPARDQLDRVAVDQQVMTARVATTPLPPPGMDLPQMYQQRLETLRKESPERYGEKITEKDRREIEQLLIQRWHTIAPMGASGFLFTDLEQAKRLGNWVQLRFKPKASQSPPDGLVRLVMQVNGRPFTLTSGFADDLPHVVDIPTSLIDAKGNLLVVIGNINPENPEATPNSSISFTPGEGMQIFYRVGSFEPNLARSLAMVWVRLCFLAVLGLAAGSFLGFPVACLLSLMVFVTASASGFLSESLNYYAALPTQGSLWDTIVAVIGQLWGKFSTGHVWEGIKIIIRLFGNGFVALIPSFSDFNPTPLVTDGLLVSYEHLGRAVLWIGVIWSGVCGVIGWVILQKRELARVIV